MNPRRKFLYSGVILWGTYLARFLPLAWVPQIFWIPQELKLFEMAKQAFSSL